MRESLQFLGLVMVLQGISGAIDHLAVQPFFGLFLNLFNRVVIPRSTSCPATSCSPTSPWPSSGSRCWCSPTGPSRPEWGVPGDDLEGVAAVEKGRPVAHGDDRDQTVDRAADRLSPGAAVAVEGGGGLVVGPPPPPRGG